MTNRFRWLLPIIFLIISVVLTNIGEHRRGAFIDRSLSQFGSLHEPVPDHLATARFVDFALNAPAWAAAWNMPELLSGYLVLNKPEKYDLLFGRVMRYDAHWWYFFYLIAMWASVGWLIDRKRLKLSTRIGVRRLAGGLCFIYGLFVIWTGWRFSDWDYERWFLLCVYLWGGLLCCVGTYTAFARKSQSPASRT